MVPDSLRSCVARNLDDPWVARWAVGRLEDLRFQGLYDEARLLENAWFADPAVLRRHLEDATSTTPVALLRRLPPERFAPLADVFVERWREWPGSLAGMAASTFAAVEPEAAAAAFARALEDSSERASDFVLAGIVAALPRLPIRLQEPILARLAAVAGPEVLGEAALRTLTALAAPDAEPGAPEGAAPSPVPTAAILGKLAHGHWRQREDHAQSLAEWLTGQTTPFRLAFDFAAGRRRVGLAGIEILFRPDTPLAEFDRLCLGEARAALREILVRCSTDSASTAAKVFARLFDRVVDEAPEEALPTLRALGVAVLAAPWMLPEPAWAELSPAKLLILAALDVPRAPFHAGLAEALRRQPRDEVVALLPAILRASSGQEGSTRVVEAVSELEWPELAPILVDVLATETDGGACLAVQGALVRLGSHATALLARRWPELDDSQRLHGLGVLEIVADDHARRLLAERCDDFADEDLGAWCLAVPGLLDPAFLDLLARRFELGSVEVDEAFYVLCRLLGVDRPELPEVLSRLDEQRTRDQELRMRFESDEAWAPLAVELACSTCAATAVYRVSDVVVDPDDDDAAPYIADEIPCRHCGEISDLTPTPEGQLRLRFAEKADRLTGRGKKSGHFRRMNGSLADGRHMSIAGAAEHYRVRLAHDPDDVETLLSLGNHCSHLGRPISGARYFRRCLELEPQCVEAAWGLAHFQLDEERPREALAVLAEALTSEGSWKYYRLMGLSPTGFRREFASEYEALRRFLGDPSIPPAPASLTAPRVKVGRNDPCPCGSGKKYKKCCG